MNFEGAARAAHFRMTASHPPFPPPVTCRLLAAWEADIADPVSGFFMLRREILEGAELLDTALDAVGLEVILVDVSPNGTAERIREINGRGRRVSCLQRIGRPHHRLHRRGSGGISVLRCLNAARREAAAADAGDPGERAD